MARFAPLRLRLVRPDWTDRVPSPAHDSLTPLQRVDYLRSRPYSYLGVTRGQEDHDGSEPISANDLVVKGREALDRLLDEGAFSDLGGDRFYAYRLDADGWCQTGIVGGVHMDDYESGTIRIHEEVQAERAQHLALHADVVGAQSSPVAVAHHPNRRIAGIIDEVAALAPDLDFEMPDGLQQTVWTIPDSYTETIRSELDEVQLYLIDGHHRTAAAAMRYADGGAPWMLAALFSTDQLQNRAFHRMAIPTVDDPLKALLGLEGAKPGRIGDGIGHLQIYFDGSWVTVPHSSARRPLERLDTWQFEHNIRPVLGEGTAVRYQQSEGAEAELLAAMDRGGELLALMSAVTMPQLFAVADAGDVMPPKSTYFEPKVRSGLFLRSL